MAASTDSQILPLILQEVQDSRREMSNWLERQAKIEQEVRDHKQDKDIHQSPPCTMAKNTDKKVNAILATSIAGVLGMLGFLLKATYGKLFP